MSQALAMGVASMVWARAVVEVQSHRTSCSSSLSCDQHGCIDRRDVGNTVAVLLIGNHLAWSTALSVGGTEDLAIIAPHIAADDRNASSRVVVRLTAITLADGSVRGLREMGRTEFWVRR